MAYENKVFLVTDFQDLETPDDVVDIFFNANHTSGDVFKSNTIMTCNWLLGRQREESVGEEENLYIPAIFFTCRKNIQHLNVSGSSRKEIWWT